MDQASLYGKGVSFPPRVGADGRIAWSAGANNVRECIRVILLTNPGERLRRQTFGAGLARFLFEPNTVATHVTIQERIETALAQWEPRIRVESVSVVADQADPQAAIATVTYQLIATQVLERMSITVQLTAQR